MKPSYLLFFLSTLILSCQTKTEKNYSDFDTIDWHSIDIGPVEINDLRKAPNSLSLQKLKLDIIENDTPNSLTDTLFIREMQNIDFKKQVINEEQKVSEINKIFRDKSNGKILAMACIPAYRDILIFRKRGEIVGISKVCLDC